MKTVLSFNHIIINYSPQLLYKPHNQYSTIKPNKTYNLLALLILHNIIFSPKCRFWNPILSFLYFRVIFFALVRMVFATCSQFFAPSSQNLYTLYAPSSHSVCTCYGLCSQFSTCTTQPLHSLFALRVRRTCIKSALKWCRIASLDHSCIIAA